MILCCRFRIENTCVPNRRLVITGCNGRNQLVVLHFSRFCHKFRNRFRAIEHGYLFEVYLMFFSQRATACFQVLL